MADNTSNYKLKITTESDLAAIKEAERSFDRLKRKAAEMNSGSSGGGFFKPEDKVSLGGGYKVVGGAGAALAGVAAALAAVSEFGNALKSYKDKIAAGANANEAMIVAMREVASKIPLIGGVLDGLQNLADELSGEANKVRQRAARAEQEAQQQRKQDRRAGYRDVQSGTQNSRQRLYEEDTVLTAGDQFQQGFARNRLEAESRIKDAQARQQQLKSATGITDRERIIQEQKIQDEIEQIKRIQRLKDADVMKAQGEEESRQRMEQIEQEEQARKKADEDAKKRQEDILKANEEVGKRQDEANKRQTDNTKDLISGRASLYGQFGMEADAKTTSRFAESIDRIEKLKEILNDKSSSAGMMAEARKQMGFTYQSFVNSQYGTVNGSEFVNASLAKSSPFVLGGGIASSAVESATLTQEQQDAKETAENTKKMAELLAQLIEGKTTVRAIFGNN